MPARICSVIWIATARAVRPSSPLTFGRLRSRTHAVNEASSMASGSPYSIGISSLAKPPSADGSTRTVWPFWPMKSMER